MVRVGFHPAVQGIRAVVILFLLIFVHSLEPLTPASKLDRIWLIEFFKLMLAFFVVINFLLCLIVAISAPQIIVIIIRFFGSVAVALSAHIYKGFSLYDELEEEELKSGRDSATLYFMRLFFLFFCCAFTFYLFMSCCCLCC